MSFQSHVTKYGLFITMYHISITSTKMSKFILKVKLKELNPDILKHIAVRGFFEDDVTSIPRDQNLENKFF